jgi:hypothetical protein
VWFGFVSLYYGRVFLSGKKMAAALLAAIKRAGEQHDSGVRSAFDFQSLM